MKRSKFTISYLSTGEYEKSPNGNLIQTSISLQLPHWREANREYDIYNNLIDKRDWSYIKRIVLNLGQCLTDLFGANYTKPINKKKTPSLMDYINTIYPDEYGWNLKIEEPELYYKLTELDCFHKDLCKHFDRSKISKLEDTTMEKLNQFMETTREAFIWFMRKKNNGVITDDMIKELQKVYIK